MSASLADHDWRQVPGRGHGAADPDPGHVPGSDCPRARVGGACPEVRYCSPLAWLCCRCLLRTFLVTLRTRFGLWSRSDHALTALHRSLGRSGARSYITWAARITERRGAASASRAQSMRIGPLLAATALALPLGGMLLACRSKLIQSILLWRADRSRALHEASRGRLGDRGQDRLYSAASGQLIFHCLFLSLII